MIFDPYMAPTMPNMVISPMVMNPFISKAYPVYHYLGNMHNTNILGEYNTCHLFHLVIQFYEVMKRDSISFVLKVLC